MPEGFMDHSKIQKFISNVTRFVVGLLVLVVIFSFLALEAEKRPQAEIQKILEQERVAFQALSEGKSKTTGLSFDWPPKMNTAYPDIALIDQKGASFSLSSLAGKTVIVEFIDMTSPISQAQSGASILGAYGGVSEVDAFAMPFSDVLKQNTDAGITLPKDNVIILKVIVYGKSGAQGSRDDAQNWAEHFNLQKSNGYIVAVSEKDLRNDDTANLIGGYQLLDRYTKLRVDSAGALPKHNLKITLIPLAEKLMRN